MGLLNEESLAAFQEKVNVLADALASLPGRVRVADCVRRERVWVIGAHRVGGKGPAGLSWGGRCGIVPFATICTLVMFLFLPAF